jgi:(S)-2-hydroxyglutarate dehydrogenase
MSTNNNYDVIIIGGGVVGTALAVELGARFRNVLLLEKENAVGLHTSGRNSGVIHSGFNTKPGTLKAKLCVEGSRLLRLFCREHQIPMEEVGTLVVANTASEIEGLSRLKARGDANGVFGIQIIDGRELRYREPNALGEAAMLSPTGAIVDAGALTRNLAEQAKGRGVTIEFTKEVVDFSEASSQITVKTSSGSFTGQLAINCAGLQSDRLAHHLGVGKDYTVLPFRGEYFAVKREGPPIIRSMLYHVPNPLFPFLGIHVTKTVQGPVLLGPNAVPAFGREAYRPKDVNWRDLTEMVKHPGPRRALLNKDILKLGFTELRNSYSRSHFLKEASHLVKGLELQDLAPEQRVGIRPQLVDRSGKLVDDLVIETTPRSVHILNVVSPGMTSALAFARWLSGNIDDSFTWTRAQRETLS